MQDIFFKYFFYVKQTINPLYFIGRIIFLFILIIWSLKFFTHSVESNYVGRSFFHLVNLVFHEAGHILFIPFGKFISTLGGSLTQLLIPFICMITFVFKTQDTFGGSIAFWWFGQNFMDIAPYINDARAQELILLGGVTGKETVDYHDWEYILRHLNFLEWDIVLANFTHIIGIIIMTIAIIWGSYILSIQYKRMKKKVYY